MTMTFSGDGTITGLTAGGLPNSTVQQADLAANVAGNGPAFGAYFAGSFTTISNGTWTKIPLNTEEFDTNSNFDKDTNYRFTPTVAGYYQINASVQADFSTAQFSSFYVAIYKNGTNFKQNQKAVGTSVYNYGAQPVSSLIYMNGTTDYLELYVQTGGGTGVGYQSGQVATYMNGFLAKAA